MAHLVVEPENTVNPLLDVLRFYGNLFHGLAQISGKDVKQLVVRLFFECPTSFGLGEYTLGPEIYIVPLLY